jgi:hypothetical protein
MPSAQHQQGLPLVAGTGFDPPSLLRVPATASPAQFAVVLRQFARSGFRRLQVRQAVDSEELDALADF